MPYSQRFVRTVLVLEVLRGSLCMAVAVLSQHLTSGGAREVYLRAKKLVTALTLR